MMRAGGACHSQLSGREAREAVWPFSRLAFYAAHLKMVFAIIINLC